MLKQYISFKTSIVTSAQKWEMRKKVAIVIAAGCAIHSFQIRQKHPYMQKKTYLKATITSSMHGNFFKLTIQQHTHKIKTEKKIKTSLCSNCILP